jgi:hypothetical protein
VLARTDVRRALEVAKGIKDPSSRGSTLALVAKPFAEENPEQALKEARAIASEADRAQALAGMAEGLAQSDPDRALEVAEEAMALVRRVRQDLVARSVAAGPLGALCAVACALRDSHGARAERLGREVLEMARGVEDREYPDAMSLAAVAHVISKNDPEEGLEVARGIKNGWRRAWALMDIASSLAKTDPDRALAVTREMKEQSLQVLSLANVANALAETDPARAIEVGDEALAVARRIRDPLSRAQTLRRLADTVFLAPQPLVE